jgi:hypothetical protein
MADFKAASIICGLVALAGREGFISPAEIDLTLRVSASMIRLSDGFLAIAQALQVVV